MKFTTIVLAIFLNFCSSRAEMITNMNFGEDYVERNADVQLDSALMNTACIVNICGFFGSGKLSSIKSYIQRNQNKYQIVWVIDIGKGLDDIHDLLYYIDNETAFNNKLSHKQKISKLKRLLTKKYNWLLVFKNIDNYHKAKFYFPAFNSNKMSNIIVLSQKRMHHHLPSISLDKLSFSEAKKLVKKRGVRGINDTQLMSLLEYSENNISTLSQYIDLYIIELNQGRKNFTDFISSIHNMKKIVSPTDTLFHFLNKRYPEALVKYHYLKEISHIHSLSLLKELKMLDFIIQYRLGACVDNTCYIEKDFGRLTKLLDIDDSIKEKICIKISEQIIKQKIKPSKEKEGFLGHYIRHLLEYGSFSKNYRRRENVEYEVLSHIVFELREWSRVKNFYEVNYSKIINSNSFWKKKLASVYAFGISHFEGRHEEAIKLIDSILTGDGGAKKPDELTLQKVQALFELNRMQEGKDLLDGLSVLDSDDFNYGLYCYLKALFFYYNDQEMAALAEINKIKGMENHASGLIFVMLQERAKSLLPNYQEDSDLKCHKFGNIINSKEFVQFSFLERTLMSRKFILQGNFHGSHKLLNTNKAIACKLPEAYKSYIIESDLVEGEWFLKQEMFLEAHKHYLRILMNLRKNPLSKHKYYRLCLFGLAKAAKGQKNMNDLYRYITKYKKYSFDGDRKLIKLLSYVSDSA